MRHIVAGVFVSLLALSAAQAAPTELFFSEYIEGTSNSKALEIFNGTGAAVNLATDTYVVQMYFNGSSTAGLTVALTGTVANNDVFVLATATAHLDILGQADQTSTSGFFNGDDAVVLRKGGAAGTIVDVIGVIGTDPGTEWGTLLTSTADNTLRRKAAICAGDTNGADAFDPATEWDGFATDTFAGLGAHSVTCGGDNAPSVQSTVPADNAGSVAAGADISITFSEDVNVTGSWFTISCVSSGAHSAVESGGPLTFTLDPDSNFTAGESCTVTVVALQVTDQDASDPPDVMAADHVFDFTVASVCGDPATAIHDVQGNGAASPIDGSSVTIEGLVVGDFQTSAGLSGFFVQEESADADPLTSEGIFVFDGGAPAVAVAVGDLVRVSGTVDEFNGLTEISPVTSVAVCSTGSALPVAIGLSLPLAAADALEPYEGMLVTFDQQLFVTDVFSVGRFGEVDLASGARLLQPTNVVAPGAPAIAQQAANDLNRVLLDDGRTSQNPDPTPYLFDSTLDAVNDPTLRVGDSVAGLTGAMHFAFSRYRIQPVSAPVFARSNPRPTSPPPVGGTLRVSSFNVLNYFNGNGAGGGFPTARGATSAAEFARQRDKIIAALIALDGDVVGILELENDDTDTEYGAIEDLVDGLNAVAGAGTYSFIDTGVVGTDEIRVAILYQPGTITPIGATATLTTGTFSNSSRPPVAQVFSEVTTGETFMIVENHFKSKGGCDVSDPDIGDGQSCWNQTRVQSATELLDWLATDPTGTGETKILIMGDINAYRLEDPIITLQNGGYANLLGESLGANATSFSFFGQAGALDHALASTDLEPMVTGVTSWAINADEPIVLDYNFEFKSAAQQALEVGTPYRSSDHDPIVVGLDLVPPGFYTLAPCRLYDSRQSLQLSDEVAREVPAAGLCGVPPGTEGATHVAVNITVLHPASSGEFFVYDPDDGPTVANLPFNALVTRANNAIVGLNADGELGLLVDLAGAAGVDVVIDVSGYFAP